jgi:inosine-uridine nucleoside N-ribohydrolase
MSDTDIGSDIDDAVCLAYLLKQPRCELVGITTVSGQAQSRASLADALCRAAGHADVPIHAGSEQGLLLGVVQPECPQAAVLPRFPHRAPEEFPKNTAVEFLRDRINSRPGELTLLTIGPLTNVGILFSLDRDLPSKLKRLVMMCGVFSAEVGAREWNALCDPIATAIAYRAEVAEHVSIGLDVTMRCRKPSQECIQRFESIGGPLAVVAAMSEVWAKRAGIMTFHDPLAAVSIFEPGICDYQSGRVDVELKSDRVPGMTLFTRDAKPSPHRAALGVDPEAFFQHYFEVISRV